MPTHKFHVGQLVQLIPSISRHVPGGSFEITKRLPESGGEFEYRIKSMERAARARRARKPVASRVICLPQGPGNIMDWDDYFRQQAVMYRQHAQKTEETFSKQELLDLAAVCEEVANNIEDRRPSG